MDSGLGQCSWIKLIEDGFGGSGYEWCGFEEVSYEVGMAESVGICEAISYLLSLFRQQTLVSVLFGDLSRDLAIPTLIHL